MEQNFLREGWLNEPIPDRYAARDRVPGGGGQRLQSGVCRCRRKFGRLRAVRVSLRLFRTRTGCPGQPGQRQARSLHAHAPDELVPAVPMPFTQATAGMPGTGAAGKPQHARQLDVNLFSDVKKLRLRDRNLTSEKIFTCYRPDPAPEGRAAARPATPQAKRHWRMTRDQVPTGRQAAEPGRTRMEKVH